MTKHKQTITLSSELHAAIGLLAIEKDMNYSEYVETRLRMLPEVIDEIKQIKNLPKNPPPMLRGDAKEFLERSSRKSSRKSIPA